MTLLLNRAEARDEIRRVYLSITPPVDSGTGNVGDAPANRPDPSNPVLNSCIVRSLAEINAECEFNENPTAFIAVGAQSDNGPFRFNLGSGWGSGVGPGAVNDIRLVLWDDLNAGTNLVQLTPTGREEYIKNYGTYANVTPGIPSRYWLEGYTLVILPSPANYGTLRIIGGTSPLAPISDSSYIDGLPADYQDCVWLGAAVMFWRGKLPDAQAGSKLTIYEPVWKDKKSLVKAWVFGKNDEYQMTIGFASPRVGQGLRGNNR